MTQRYYEDIPIGYKLQTAWRTITQEMIDRFAELTGDKNPIHIDEASVSKSLFGRTIAKGKRIAHGELTGAVAIGLLNDYSLLEGMGLLVVVKKYIRPVWSGDSIFCCLEVEDKRPREKMKGFGVLDCHIEVYNQDEKQVADILMSILAERREAA